MHFLFTPRLCRTSGPDPLCSANSSAASSSYKHTHYVFQVRVAASENTTTNTQQSARISLFHFRVRQRVTMDFLVLVLQRGGPISAAFIKYKSCTFVLSDGTSKRSGGRAWKHFAPFLERESILNQIMTTRPDPEPGLSPTRHLVRSRRGVGSHVPTDRQALCN